MRKDPLARAMRPDKVDAARRWPRRSGSTGPGSRGREIPVWRMIAAPADELRARADAPRRARLGDRAEPWSSCARRSAVGRCRARRSPSCGVALDGRSADRTLAALRRGDPTVIGRVDDDRVVLDLRTVEPGARTTALAAAIERALAGRA